MSFYISFISMTMTVLIVGLFYYFTTKYLASFVGEDYRQAMAISLGIVAVAISYKMMGVIEGDKDSVIEETERMANRLMDSIRKDLD